VPLRDGPLTGAPLNFPSDPSGPGGVQVDEGGVPVVADAQELDFTGAGVGVTQTGPNRARVDIPGGALPPFQQATFQDNTSLDIPIGTTADGSIFINANLSTPGGDSTVFEFLVGIAPGGTAALDCPQADALGAIDVDPQVAVVGPTVVLRLVGTGVGNPVGITYRIVDVLPRVF
jgi:hypothetical protein